MQNYYTLEYSPSQKCFRHDIVSSMVEHNLHLCLDARFRGEEILPEYICLGIFKTREERQAVTDHLCKIFVAKGLRD